MFVKQIRCSLASATRLALNSRESSRDGTLRPSVVTGGALVVATLFGVSVPITPAHADGISVSVPTGTCASWTVGGTATAPTLTCVPPVQTAGTPSNCALTANPSTITGPTNVTLTATCNSNASDPSTTWAWTGGTAAASTGPGASPQSQIVQNVSATTTFYVTASNANGAGPTKSATVTLSTGGGGGGGGGGGTISCPGYANTYVMLLNYVPGSGQIVKSSAGQGPGDITVVTFTTPATIAGGYGQNGLVGVADNYYGGSTTAVSATFSTTPCTTTPSTWPGSSTRSLSPGVSTQWGFNTYKLAPLTTYYVNMIGSDPLDVKLTAK